MKIVCRLRIGRYLAALLSQCCHQHIFVFWPVATGRRSICSTAAERGRQEQVLNLQSFKHKKDIGIVLHSPMARLMVKLIQNHNSKRKKHTPLSETKENNYSKVKDDICVECELMYNAV